MKGISRERIAPYVLGLAIIAALVAFGGYVVYHSATVLVKGSLGASILLLAVYTYLAPEKVQEAFTGRRARYGSNALVLFLAVVGILAAINYIAYQFPKRWDLTTDKSHTLDQVTLDTLAQLPAPVKATAFFTHRMSRDEAQTLLDQYAFASHGKFSYKFVDPEAQPALAQQEGITRDGTIVLQMGDQTEKVTIASEKEITGALVRLMHPNKQKVYFLTGHGERSPKAFENTGYSTAKSELENKNYTVETLSLLKHSAVPDDAEVVIIADPKKPLGDEEIKALQDFLAKGGGVLVMLEPNVTQETNTERPLVAFLQNQWHLELTPDLVIDPLANPATVVVSYQYGAHEITTPLQTLATIFPTARTVGVPAPVPDGFLMTALVKSEPNAWGETNLAGLQKQQVNQDKDDLPGPVSVAAAVENSKTHGRLVVIGDADFASNAYYTAYGNADFFLNAIDWLSNQKELIQLNPRTPTQRVMLPPQQNTLGLILLLTVFVLPGSVLLAGIAVWVRRRRRA